MATAVSTVLVKRVPNSGTPSTRSYAIGVTVPVWISAAAALVTAEVTRLVAPVWSSGPNGEALTRVLQSLWADAMEATPQNAMVAMSARNFMLFLSPGMSHAWAHGLLVRLASG